MGRIEESRSSYASALTLLKETGDRQAEGITMGNLGDLLLQHGSLEEAEDMLVQAVEICDENWEVAAACFRGSLGLIAGRRGNFDEARQLLNRAESQLRGIHAEELCKLLCKKGEVEEQAGNRKGAIEALKEAESISERLSLGRDSEGERALAGLRERLASRAN
jgi:tetratricopeptide (TPR) repeat protein